MTAPSLPPIRLAGRGNSAAVTALCLAAAGLTVEMEGPPPAPAPDTPPPDDDWQRVLALSPTSKTLLERLGVWDRLAPQATPVCDVHVVGRDGGTGLHFAPPATSDASGQATDMLAYIVSLPGLGRALQASLADAMAETGSVHYAEAGFTDIGTAPLLVDADSQPRPWRAAAGLHALRYDYGAAALVCAVTHEAAHGHVARQVFLPDGPLALLPLPEAHRSALVWSLPTAKAKALASVPETLFLHELRGAAAALAPGALQACGPRATQALRLHMAQGFVAQNIVLVGEAAHAIHPLAGQGFNLTLRDAACLADVLFDAQALGLGLTDAAMLEAYQTARRADAGVLAATTHTLSQLFASAPQLGQTGLAASGVLAAQAPGLAIQARQQADGGLAPLPRLMRGQAFAAPSL